MFNQSFAERSRTLHQRPPALAAAIPDPPGQWPSRSIAPSSASATPARCWQHHTGSRAAREPRPLGRGRRTRDTVPDQPPPEHPSVPRGCQSELRQPASSSRSAASTASVLRSSQKSGLSRSMTRWNPGPLQLLPVPGLPSSPGKGSALKVSMIDNCSVVDSADGYTGAAWPEPSRAGQVDLAVGMSR